MGKQKIRITSTRYAEDDKETEIVDTDAVITGSSDDYTIAYIEAIGDAAGGETIVRVKGNRRITVSRRNAVVSSFIIIEKGIRHVTHYTNSGLSFNMGISCSELDSDFEGGRLHFRYETDYELKPFGEIEFEFIFRKTED